MKPMMQKMGSVLNFTDTWLDNIEKQGYELFIFDKGRVTDNISL